MAQLNSVWCLVFGLRTLSSVHARRGGRRNKRHWLFLHGDARIQASDIFQRAWQHDIYMLGLCAQEADFFVAYVLCFHPCLERASCSCSCSCSCARFIILSISCQLGVLASLSFLTRTEPVYSSLQMPSSSISAAGAPGARKGWL